VTVTIEDSVILGGASSDSPGECHANGLRVQSDGATSDREAPVILRHSLVEGAREAGVLVQGAAVKIEGSIVRGTVASACGDSGDGVAVYGDSRMPAAVAISGSRIDASARAGLASFGGVASLDASAIDGCAVAAIATDTRGGALADVVAQESACRCSGARRLCAATPRSLAPALRGGNGCDFADGVCSRLCFDDVTGRLSAPSSLPTDAVSPVSSVVQWMPEDLGVAPAKSGDDGCTEWGSLPPSSTYLGAAARDGFLPTFTRLSAGPAHAVPARVGVPPDFVFSVWWNASGRLPDARRSPVATVFACRSLDPSTDRSTPAERCIGRGAAGVTLAAVAGVAGGEQARAYYGNDAGALDIVTPAITAAGSYGGFLDGGPGDVLIRLLPGAGQHQVRCRSDPFADGWTAGDFDQPDLVRMPTRPGFFAFAFAYCDVE
jgi:hypothetical protein